MSLQGKMIPLDLILETITKHGEWESQFLTPHPSFQISCETIIDEIVEQVGCTKEEMGEYFDEVRVRVHGDKIKKG